MWRKSYRQRKMAASRNQRKHHIKRRSRIGVSHRHGGIVYQAYQRQHQRGMYRIIVSSATGNNQSVCGVSVAGGSAASIIGSIISISNIIMTVIWRQHVGVSAWRRISNNKARSMAKAAGSVACWRGVSKYRGGGSIIRRRHRNSGGMTAAQRQRHQQTAASSV